MPKNKKIQKIYEQIAILTEEAQTKLKEAEKLADENGLEFVFNLGHGEKYHGKGSMFEYYDYHSDIAKQRPRKNGVWINSSSYCC